MIIFNCPHCSTGIRAKDEAAGTVARCGKCEQRLKVPVAEKVGEAAPARPPVIPTQHRNEPTPARREISTLGAVSCLFGTIALAFCWMPLGCTLMAAFGSILGSGGLLASLGSRGTKPLLATVGVGVNLLALAACYVIRDYMAASTLW